MPVRAHVRLYRVALLAVVPVELCVCLVCCMVSPTQSACALVLFACRDSYSQMSAVCVLRVCVCCVEWAGAAEMSFCYRRNMNE
jgi:hypothetical protein